MTDYREKLLNEAGVFDGLIAFRFVQLLTKPFESWPAFELGIIDEKGKSLKKAKSSEEKKAFGLFHRLVRNIKLLMAKMPGGSTKLASYAAALFLLKENYSLDDATVNKMMDCIIELADASDLKVVYPLTEDIKILRITEGRYELDSGDVIIVTEDLKPKHKFLGVDLYLSETNTSGKPMLFAFENIEGEF